MLRSLPVGYPTESLPETVSGVGDDDDDDESNDDDDEETTCRENDGGELLSNRAEGDARENDGGELSNRVEDGVDVGDSEEDLSSSET